MKNKKEILGIAVVLLLFVLSAYFSKTYHVELQNLIEGREVIGMIVYVTTSFLSTVLAPLNTFFLLPVAVGLWGPSIAAILSIVGWTLGSLVAYILAQRYGYPLVRKFTNTKKLDELSKALPEKNIFLWIVIARMAVPVDALSYVLGLFLKIPLSTYTLATLVGVSPFAFLFAYAAEESGIVLIIAVVATLTAIISGAWWWKRASRDVS